MAIYLKDNPQYFEKALESVLNQTKKPSEVLIVEDGEISKELSKIIDSAQEKYKNIDIKQIKIETNKGLANALNQGIRASSNEIIARMDSDDICLPDRFEKQINFLKEHPDISVLGGYIEEFDESLTISKGIRKVPKNPEEVLEFAKSRTPINHMSAVFKKTDVLSVGGYSRALRKIQDYALWVKLLNQGKKIANIPEVLLNVRAGKSMIERRSGYAYFQYEYMVFRLMYKIGFISKFQFWKNIAIRFCIRIMPKTVISKIYFFIRKLG